MRRKLVFGTLILTLAIGIGAVPLTSKGTFTEIDSPNGPPTFVNDITPSGDMIGRGGLLGMFLSRHGDFSSFEFPGASQTRSFGINPSGDIVGQYFDPTSHGYLLSDGVFSSIDFPGARASTAWGISPRGDIVGAHNTGGVISGFLLSGGHTYRSMSQVSR